MLVIVNRLSTVIIVKLKINQILEIKICKKKIKQIIDSEKENK